tara:strand:- start:9214 stop:9828 length:615 start_codon:yes stop_codon:yes gene_type:complete
MATINQSQFNKSRLDKFLLVLNLPPILKDISKQYLGARENKVVIENSLQFSVYGTVVPSIRVPEENLGYAGQSFKVSKHSRPAYENVSVNFTIDNEFNNYWVIYKWLDLLNDEKNSQFNGKDIFKTPNVSTKERNQNKTLTSPELYQTDITLYALDEFDKTKVKFVYTDAFPVDLGGIDFNYRSAGEIETTFEFAFSQLLVELV